jgi:hypothetical protein
MGEPQPKARRANMVMQWKRPPRAEARGVEAA